MQHILYIIIIGPYLIALKPFQTVSILMNYFIFKTELRLYRQDFEFLTAGLPTQIQALSPVTLFRLHNKSES